MAASTLAANTIDGAGTEFQFDLDGVPTYTVLPGIQGDIPEISSGDAWEDDTELAATTQSFYKKEREEAQDLELVIADLPGDTTQTNFTDKVIARTSIPCRVIYSTGRQVDFNFLPQNHKGGAASEGEKQMFACIGKMTNITWSKVA